MDTTVPAAAPRVYARFRRRALALAIDLFILAFLILASKLVLEGFDGRLGGVGTLAIFVAYFAGFPLTKWRATPGKHACGIRITDRAGDKLGPARSLLRAAASLASMAAWGLGYAVALWTRRRQALHDLVAGTLVVHDAAPREAIAQVDPPAPPLGKRIVKTAVFVAALTFPVYVYLYPLNGLRAMEINDINMRETLPVVAALDAYRKKNGRYPDNLAALHPEYLPRLPALAERTPLYYAVEGDQCWLAIVYWRDAGLLPHDRVNEYECKTREWTNLDYVELTAKPEAGLTMPK